MALRLQARQDELAEFLAGSKADVENIRGYFKWVSGVYDRTYGHYALVIGQANAQAETQQQVLDYFVGFVTGVAVGVLFEAALGAAAIKASEEILLKVAGEGVEGLVGAGMGAAGAKPEIAKATISDDLNPAFKKIQALQFLVELNRTVLALAVPGPLLFAGPIGQAAMLSAELRVAEAKGARKMSDDDIRQGYLELMRFDVQSLMMATTLQAQKARFEALRAAYMGKQAPSDQRCEQDIWVQWLAKQNPRGSWGGMFGSIVVNKVIANHLVDLGLAAPGVKGGRLNADITYHNPTLEPGHENDEPSAWQIVGGAQREAASLQAYWNDVFLLAPAAKK